MNNLSDNLQMKRMLIMQSFAPLFLILFIKYFDTKLFYLGAIFIRTIRKAPEETLSKLIAHPLCITFFLEIFCLLWVICSICSIREFAASQRADFVSQGESLVEIEKISDSGVTFFMTYVLPMAMDNLDTLKGIIVFGILMIMLFLLMWKTNLYYQNPILTVLGYEVFSFKFETTQLVAYREKECIGITRNTVRNGQTVKRQKISDNVFLVYEENIR